MAFILAINAGVKALASPHGFAWAAGAALLTTNVVLAFAYLRLSRTSPVRGFAGFASICGIWIVFGIGAGVALGEPRAAYNAVLGISALIFIGLTGVIVWRAADRDTKGVQAEVLRRLSSSLLAPKAKERR